MYFNSERNMLQSTHDLKRSSLLPNAQLCQVPERLRPLGPLGERHDFDFDRVNERKCD